MPIRSNHRTKRAADIRFKVEKALHQLSSNQEEAISIFVRKVDSDHHQWKPASWDKGPAYIAKTLKWLLDGNTNESRVMDFWERTADSILNGSSTPSTTTVQQKPVSSHEEKLSYLILRAHVEKNSEDMMSYLLVLQEMGL